MWLDFNGENHEDRYPPHVQRHHGSLQLRQHIRHPIHQVGRSALELCNECHPFFTGKQKLVDTGGRVERFNKRYGERKTK